MLLLTAVVFAACLVLAAICVIQARSLSSYKKTFDRLEELQERELAFAAEPVPTHGGEADRLKYWGGPWSVGTCNADIYGKRMNLLRIDTASCSRICVDELAGDMLRAAVAAWNEKNGYITEDKCEP